MKYFKLLLAVIFLSLFSNQAYAILGTEFVGCSVHGFERWRAVSTLPSPSNGSTNTNHTLFAPFGTAVAGPVNTSGLTYLQDSIGTPESVWSYNFNSADGDQFNGPVQFPQEVCPCTGGGNPMQSIYDGDGKLVDTRDQDHPAFSPDENAPVDYQAEQMAAHLEQYEHDIAYIEESVEGRSIRLPHLPQLQSANGHKISKHRSERR